MSEIFVSYDHATSTDRAQEITEALRALGYTAWRDDDLPPHRVYAEVLQERVEQAKAVLVLWSKASVRSQWVRSEANRAREEDKLVQASLDGVMPPMPFDQIHCVQLTGSLDSPDWRKIALSIGDLVGRPPQGAEAWPTHSHAIAGHKSPASSTPKARARLVIAGVAATALAAAVAAGVWLAQPEGPLSPRPVTTAVKVALVPFEVRGQGREVHDFADSLQDEIVGALSAGQVEPVARSASASLSGPDARKAAERLGARLVLNGSARQAGASMQVRVHLDDPQAQTTLWSREFEGPTSDAAGLQARVAHRIFVVLGCSREALQPQTGLRDPALVSRYLHGCDVFADWDVHLGYDQKGSADFGEVQRALTQRAPDFAPPHFTLAVIDALAAGSATPANAAAMRREAQTHIDRGEALDPKSPMRFAAASLLLKVDDWAERERLLRQAVATAPSDPLSNYWLGVMLAGVGRVREAQEFSQRSTAGDFVYDWGIFNSVIVCLTPPFDRPIKDIAGFRRQLPTSLFAQDTQVWCLSNARRWDEAQQILKEPPGAGAGAFLPSFSDASGAVLRAAASGAAPDRAAARRLALAKAEEGQWGLLYAMGWLSSLGYVDDAAALSARYDPAALPSRDFNLLLFAPSMDALRRDPRFMQMAARIGLARYWRESGHWPDFCADRTLPYDCKTEAAKAATRTKSGT